jgi:hypothetical protein
MADYNVIDGMIGRTFTAVKQINGSQGDELHFYLDEEKTRYFRFYHWQDCCENVRIEEIHGDLEDLVGTPLIVAEERVEHKTDPDYEYDSSTWTFYEFRTIKGSVTVRWLGTSNGYYSERVDLELIGE